MPDVERDFAEVGVAAAQDRDDALDGDFGIRGRPLLAGFRIEPVHPAPGIEFARLRSCTPRIPLSPHAIPHRPIAVLKVVYPYPNMTPPNPPGIIAPPKAGASGILRLG